MEENKNIPPKNPSNGNVAQGGNGNGGGRKRRKKKHKNGGNGNNPNQQNNQNNQNQQKAQNPQNQQNAPKNNQNNKNKQQNQNPNKNKQQNQSKDENRKDTYAYVLDGNLYINLTNKCSNGCDFCVRNERTSYYGNYLWLKHPWPPKRIQSKRSSPKPRPHGDGWNEIQRADGTPSPPF